MQNKMENTITIIEIENHLTKWFGSDWNNQSSTQILAMTIGLLAKVNVEVVSEEDLQNECELNGLENQTNEC